VTKADELADSAIDTLLQAQVQWNPGLVPFQDVMRYAPVYPSLPDPGVV